MNYFILAQLADNWITSCYKPPPATYQPTLIKGPSYPETPYIRTQQNWLPHLKPSQKHVKKKLANCFTLKTCKTIPDHTQHTSSMDLQLSFIINQSKTTYFLSTFFWLLDILTCPGSLGLQMNKNIYILFFLVWGHMKCKQHKVYSGG